MVDPDQNQPNNSISGSHTSDGPCSQDETGPFFMDPIDQAGGLLEANSAMDQFGLWEADSSFNQIGHLEESQMEALLSNGVAMESGLTGVEPEGQVQVDDLLDMDWEGFAAHLWNEPAQSDMIQAAEPKTTTTGSDPDELDSFVSWLLSDAC